MHQLILGTAQLGMNYGINNKTGKPSLEESFDILETAYKKEIKHIDTAVAYGEAEEIIGKYIKKTGNAFNIITKMPKVKNGYFDENYVQLWIKESLKKLCVNKIYCYMVHNFNDIKKHKNMLKKFIELKDDGIIENIGVSLYEPSELEELLCTYGEAIDNVQIPLNILDLRWQKNNLLERLKEKNISISVRSIFLQGFLFLNHEKASAIHETAPQYLNKLFSLSKSTGKSIQELTFGFLKGISLIDFVLLGCDNKKQLQQSIDLFINSSSLSECEINLIKDNFQDVDMKIIDPRKW